MAVPVTVFSDFTCPFSYVTETALRRMEAAGEVALTHLAFELHPAPAPVAPPDRAALAALAPLARELGIPLSLPSVAARTRKAHEAAAFARGRGVEAALREAIFAAYFADGRDVGRIDVLVELGERLGLDAGEMKVVLDVDTFAARVAAEREAAVDAGVQGVPTVVAGTGDAARWMVGARPLAELRAEIRGDRPGASSPGAQS